MFSILEASVGLCCLATVVEACSMVLGGKGLTLSHLLSEVPWAVACPAWRNLVACDRDCDTVGLTLSNGSSRDKSLLSIVIPI